MGAVLDDAATLDRDDAVGPAYRGKPVGDNENGAAFTDPAHVVLNDALTLVIERAGGFVEDQNAGIGHQGTGNRDALPIRRTGIAGSASAIFSATDRLKSTSSCRTMPTCRRSQAASVIARSTP